MTTKISPSKADARKKLISRIAAAQKQADTAKKAAKLAKLGFRNAKQKFKDAKHAAKKLRKAVKTLKTELASLATARPRPKPAKPKSAAKRIQPVIVPAVALIPAPVEVTPVASDIPPGNPVA